MNDERIKDALRDATDTRDVLIGAGAISSVAEIFGENFGGSPAVVVADEDTFGVAGEEVARLLKEAGVELVDPYVFPGEPRLYAGYANIEKLVGSLKAHEAIPVSVGAGTVNDIVKRAASECDFPYLCVGTAASMDGYTSFGASISKDGRKQTLECPAPRAVLLDLDILTDAPEPMTAAGYADLLGKVTAGADWLVADALGAEEIHPTGGARVGIFDRERTAVVFQSAEWETKFPRSGQAEQDPDEWWSCLVSVTKKALEESGVSPEEIAGISVDTTGSTVVALDEKGKHLRPAIMWMDVRAADQARRIGETNDPILKYSGYSAISAEWGLPKVLWLKEKEPDTFNNAAHICDCADWLINRLTGEWAASINIVSAKYFYDRDAGGWPESLCETLEAPDLLEKLPQNVLDMGEVVGGLSKNAADELGLKPDTPVAQGGIDGFMGALGLGVVEPGKMAFVAGSSHSMFGQAAEPLYAQGFFGAFTDAQIPGQYTIEAGQASTGSVVAWFKNGLAKGAAEGARERDVDPYEVLDELAREVPRGSDGLVVLDSFQGNRTPHTDPLARGVIWGLSPGHGEGHIFRAILEGVCYGTEHILGTMRGNDFEPKEIVVSGGPTKSALWMQMHADVSNVPISLTKEKEAPVLGNAMLAAVGAGIYKDIPEAAQNMVHTARTIEPDEEAHEEYKFYVDRYIETYPAMRELMHKTAEHLSE